MIDLCMGRRTSFLECEFWSVDERDLIPADQICHTRIPTGMFFAKEINSYSTENQIIESSFMAEQKTVTLETHDNIKTPVPLKRNDIVKFNDEVYRVDKLQVNPVRKQNQYMQINNSNITYITLRG